MSIRRIITVAAAGVMAAAITAAPSGAMAGPAVTHTWTNLDPAVSAPARGGMTMAYDPVSRSIVTFGGWDQNIQYLDQTWVWDGSQWAEPIAQTPPPARAAAGMAYDQVTHQLVLFGGWNGTTGTRFGDTWTWDGSTQQWTERTPAHNPTAVSGPMLFPDPINGHVDMVGGFDGRIFMNTTYQWTGSDWMKLNTPNSITGRGSAIAELDRANRTVVVFSGIGSLRVDDTWTFDGTTWTQESPAHQPPERFDSSSAYSPRLHGVVVFGGGSPNGNLNDTWEWNGTDWRQLHPGTPPAKRDSPGMAYDKATRMIVMFGGDVSGNPAGDTWGL
jgi:hypothetical protein